MSRRSRRRVDPDQFDLFEPPHERCEDGQGAYTQYLIAPPTELGESPQAASEADRDTTAPAYST